MAIRDLGMPTNLLDLALAVASESTELRPIYVAGYEPGYQDSFYPGLYDPETAADVTPLLNAFEAGARAMSGRWDRCEFDSDSEPPRDSGHAAATRPGPPVAAQPAYLRGLSTRRRCVSWRERLIPSQRRCSSDSCASPRRGAAR